MDVATGSIIGLLIFKPTPHPDDRGFFSRTFDADITRLHGIDPYAFVQDSLSRSAHGVIRGLHLRSGKGEAKIVRCSFGEIFDVVVDLRPGSPTFLQVETFRLRDDTCQSIYVPAGCAHGFQAITEPADVAYRIDRPHDPSEDVAIAFDDPELAIPWPFPPTQVADRDRRARSLAEVLETNAISAKLPSPFSSVREP
jgi:dTDP-4-dehydrorhamnose 3,5-epimerase